MNIKKLLEVNDFSKAIKEMEEHDLYLEAFKQFKCINEVSFKQSVFFFF
jgi:hypothetical protein